MNKLVLEVDQVLNCQFCRDEIVPDCSKLVVGAKIGPHQYARD
jgi:hypothetical protein